MRTTSQYNPCHVICSCLVLISHMKLAVQEFCISPQSAVPHSKSRSYVRTLFKASMTLLLFQPLSLSPREVVKEIRWAFHHTACRQAPRKITLSPCNTTSRIEVEDDVVLRLSRSICLSFSVFYCADHPHVELWHAHHFRPPNLLVELTPSLLTLIGDCDRQQHLRIQTVQYTFHR